MVIRRFLMTVLAAWCLITTAAPADTLLRSDFTASSGTEISDLSEWLTVVQDDNSSQLVYLNQGRFVMEIDAGVTSTIRATPVLYPAIDPCGIHVEYTVKKIKDYSSSTTDNGVSSLCLASRGDWSTSYSNSAGEKLVWSVTFHDGANSADLAFHIINSPDTTGDTGVVVYSTTLTDLDLEYGDYIQLAMDLRDGTDAVRVGYRRYDGSWGLWVYSAWFDPTDNSGALGLGDDAFASDWMDTWQASTYFYMDNYSAFGRQTQVWVDDALITGNAGTPLNPPVFYLDMSIIDQAKIPLAMSDLRRCYYLITGGILPEVPTAGYIPFQVTWVSTSANEASGDPLKDWDYQIDVRVDAVEISVTTSLGLNNAIYYLLDLWGCRWVFPGDLGECVAPAGSVLPLTAGLHRIHQSTSSEQMQYGSWSGSGPNFEWIRRNRLSFLSYFSAQHYWLNAIPPATYFDPVNHPESYHPEYYALIGGVRTPTQLCTSNRDVIDLMIAKALDYFGTSSNQLSFPMDPADNIAYCQCDDCKALDPAEPRSDGLFPMTNRVATFANTVAAAVGQSFPGKQVGFYAYWTHQQPPESHITLRDNVAVPLCRTRACLLHLAPNPNCPSCMAWWDLLDEWLSICNEVRVYEYLPISWTGRLPCPLYLEHGASLAEQVRRGVYGSYSDGGLQTPVTNYPLSYMDLQMKVDATQDPNMVLLDMCQSLFGPAAVSMNSFFRTLAEISQKYFPDRVDGVGSSTWGYEALFDQVMLTTARMHLNQARGAAASDPKVLDRIDMTELGFVYLEDYLDGMWTAQNGDYQGFLDAFDAVDDDIDDIVAYETDFPDADARRRMKTAKLKSQAKYFPDTMDFIRDWTILGPFDNTSLDAHITPDLFPTDFFPAGVSIGQPTQLGDGSVKPWVNYHSVEGLIDFDVPLDSSDQYFSWGYAATKVYVPTARTVRIYLSSFYAYRLFVNGTEVRSRLGLNADCPDKEYVDVSLPAGYSTVVWKSSQTAPESYAYRWGFYLRMTTTSGAIMPDLSVTQFVVPEPSNCLEVQSWGYALDGDLNGDCYVNAADVRLMAEAWLTDDVLADLSDDGHVDMNDFAQLSSAWMQCNNPTDAACD